MERCRLALVVDLQAASRSSLSLCFAGLSKSRQLTAVTRPAPWWHINMLSCSDSEQTLSSDGQRGCTL
ncbi:hypothetical protein AV530_008647 [Patagioenas fasciata monilis]|uniref:Uncharacterized protein n=1 Tax=Patagioenas fasciata monilis TaxID=372326 RepID=A0A1V4L2N8_PATFA|nr:hypothetical protein AV530_008647 [Patagioenas fasciata monilis]